MLSDEPILVFYSFGEKGKKGVREGGVGRAKECEKGKGRWLGIGRKGKVAGNWDKGF